MSTRYSQDIITDIKGLNYSIVPNLYTWITSCVDKYKPGCSYKFNVHYKYGELSCSTDNYDEFIRHTYGIEVDVFYLSISPDNLDISFNIYNYNNNVKISIYSTDVNIISKIVPSLKDIIKTRGINDSNSTTKIPEIQIEVAGDLTMIGSAIGSNNTTTNNGKTIIKKEISHKNKDSFCGEILQQIIANWIWWLLGILFVALLTYLGIDISAYDKPAS